MPPMTLCHRLLAAATLLVLLQGLQGLPALAQSAQSAQSAQETPPAAPATPATPPATAPAPAAPETPAPTAEGTPAPATPPAAPAVALPERVEFTLKFPEDQGGGSATGKVVSIEYKGDDYAVLTGSVELHYQDLVLHADKAEIDLETRLVTATGSVILDQGPRRLTGETAKFDLKTKTGTLTEATGQVSPDYYFQGREVAKIAEDTYTVTDGTFTSCNQKTPDWSFRLGTARVEVEGYAHVRHASLRAKKLPVFYTPYILWPVKSDRTSGFLIPNIGYSDRRGAELGLAYFQTIGRSYDTTFHVDTYSQGYFGIGNEFRYRPTDGTAGNLIGYTIRDPEAIAEDEWRWKVEWNHTTTDLPWGMRGVVQLRDYSDFNFFRDFEREIDRNTLRFIDSRAFVSGNWGPHLVNFLLNDRETFITFDQTVEQKKLPELEYKLRSTRLGKTPLYMQFLGSASFLDIDRGSFSDGSYGRVDLFPQLSLPVRAFPWLSVSVTTGGRFTFYGDTLEATPTGPQFAGETLTRTLPSGNAEIVGPSFSRIFNKKIGDFGKFKHVVEPRLTYTYLGDFDEVEQIPTFDEVDFVQSTNNARLALSNRVLGKTSDEKGIAREIFLFEVARSYSFDADKPIQSSFVNPAINTQDGPFEALVRFNPSEMVTIRATAEYNTLFSGLTSTSLSGNFNFGKGNNAGLTWNTNYQPEFGQTVGDQVQVFGGVDLLSRRRLRLEARVNYNVEEALLQQQRYILTWNAQCYGIRLELRDFRATAGPRLRDKDFRFSLSLKNVGTFLDLTSRSSNDAP